MLNIRNYRPHLLVEHCLEIFKEKTGIIWYNLMNGMYVCFGIWEIIVMNIYIYIYMFLQYVFASSFNTVNAT